MKIENSPEYEAQMEAALRELAAKGEAAANSLSDARAKWETAGRRWLPMDKCPLSALAETYGIEGVILVSDGEEVAIAKVHKRFGRPLFWKKEPEMVCRDGMMCLEGGEVDPRDDLPEWWWTYELMDQLEDRYEYGEHYHGDSIDFVPTRWTFLPTPPQD